MVVESQRVPDGTMAAGYEFRHSLYQRAWYQRVGPARRVELHRRIGERIETAYGDRTSEVPAELAMHFDRGRDIGKAVRYLSQAARTARRRHGAQESVTGASRAGPARDAPRLVGREELGARPEALTSDRKGAIRTHILSR
jgi:predicted ATPase